MSDASADKTGDDLAARLRTTSDDPPPEALLAAARAAYSWRTVDADLCRPSYDSLLDESLTSTRGGAGESRLVRFAGAGLALDVEVSADGDARALVGQLTPAGTADITVRQGDGSELTTVADDLGRFVVDGMHTGPLSLRCAPAGSEATLYTDWLLV